jgi:hypothetical protein
MKTTIARSALLYVSSIALGLAFTGSSDAEIDPGTVVGVWLFDEEEEDITLGDSSGNGHDGEIREGIKWVKGKFGNALEFPGLDPSYVSIPHEESLSVTTFTITAWVNMEMVPDRYPVVAAKFGTLVRNYGIAINKNSEVPYLQFHVGGNYNEFRATTKVTDKQWHHVAAAYDNEFVRFYVDGILEAEMAFNGEPDANDAPLTIGGGPGTSPARGTIDEVGLFNAGLTADEINEIMTNGLEKALGRTAVSVSGRLAATWAKIKAQ